MKIAYIAQCLIPSQLANSLQVMKMCAAFARQGHQVDLFAASGRADAELFDYYGVEPAFSVQRLPMSRLRGVAGAKFGWDCVREACRSHTPDLVYTRHVYSLYWALRAGLPVTYEMHALPGGRVHSTVLKWAFRQDNLRRVVVISEALKSDLHGAFPALAPERTLVAHDGSDLDGFHRSAGTASINHRRAGRDTFSVGYVGALYPGKGLEIVAELASLLPELDFHVVGGDDRLVRQWRDRMAVQNVYFHGFVAPSATSAWIRSFDVVLLPLQAQVSSLPTGGQDISRWTSPLKLFEYMAHGKAIVASDLPVLREVVRPEHNALVVRADDPAEWARALQRLKADPGLRRRLGFNARADVEREYTWDRRAQRVLEPEASRSTPESPLVTASD